jgi:ribonuclease HI
MPWTVALLRGQKVLARANGEGALVVEGGRVEIRYKKTDSRAYRAAASNLQIAVGEPLVPDEEVVPGVTPGAVAAVPGAAPAPAAGSATKAAKAPAPQRIDKSPDAKPTRTADGWVAFTDGACSGNPGPAGSGMVVIHPGGKIDEGFEYLGISTNNVAELTGILRALEAIPADAPSILVHTDSQYSIGVLTKGWKAKVNQELIAKTKSLLAKRPQARLVYVRGHAGIPMNERADELAREAIRVSRTKAIVLS